MDPWTYTKTMKTAEWILGTASFRPLNKHTHAPPLVEVDALLNSHEKHEFRSYVL